MTPRLSTINFKSGVDDKADEKTKNSMDALIVALDDRTCDQTFKEKAIFTDN